MALGVVNQGAAALSETFELIRIAAVDRGQLGQLVLGEGVGALAGGRVGHVQQGARAAQDRLPGTQFVKESLDAVNVGRPDIAAVDEAGYQQFALRQAPALELLEIAAAVHEVESQACDRQAADPGEVFAEFVVVGLQ